MDFIMNMALPATLILFAVMFKLYYIIRKDLDSAKKIKNFKKTIKDRERMEEAVHKTFANDVEWLVIGFFVFLFMIV